MGKFLTLSFLTIIASICNGENIPGVVPLNSGTFDKVIEKFPVSLVKFDKSHPHGDTQKAFKSLAPDTLAQSKLLLATIAIKDYGEKENQDLADRFGVKKEDFPVYKMFLSGRSEPVAFTGDTKKADDLKKFIMQESGLWLGLPACIEEFDQLAREFLQVADDKRQKIVEKTQKEADAIDNENKKERASFYVKTMQKVLEKGEDFIDTESVRVEKLLEGKLSDKKKEQLKDRSNILTVFQLIKNEEAAKKEEL